MKCKYPPDQNGYKHSQSPTVVSVQLDGGASRTRLDKLGAVYRVPVQWTGDNNMYDYMMAFYRTATAFGSLTFTIDLMIDSSNMTEYVAKFVPESFQLSSQSGFTFIVAAELEVIPIPTNQTADLALLA
jgi:hypothetical protein